ncbi:MAG: transcription antitermination factor NusB [Selenomonadaceae bacterium]|nr:transcription antitermination factor NusB [Selenomonadaceae bacterium]
MDVTEARETAFKALFQLEFAPNDETEFYEKLSIENAIEEDTKVQQRRLTYIEDAVKGTRANLAEIDEMIKSRLKKGWTLSRLSTADRNILRLAVYEMVFAEKKIPVSVAINEAIELAKKYGADDSSRFINGILNAIGNSNAATNSNP